MAANAFDNVTPSKAGDIAPESLVKGGLISSIKDLIETKLTSALPDNKEKFNEIRDTLFHLCIPATLLTHLQADEASMAEARASQTTKNASSSSTAATSEGTPSQSQKKGNRRSPTPPPNSSSSASPAGATPSATASSSSQSDPFPNDSAFLNLKEVQYLYQEFYWFVAKGESKRASVLQSMVPAGVALTIYLDIMKSILSLIETTAAQRLAAMHVHPRVVRVAKELELTPIETEAFIFVAAQTTARFYLPDDTYVASCARHCKMSPVEIMKFVDENREHMKQDLLMLNDPRGWRVLHDSRLVLNPSVALAFTGAELSEEQLIKLDHTALHTVIVDESKIGSSSSPSGGKKHHTSKGSGSDDENDEEEEDDERDEDEEEDSDEDSDRDVEESEEDEDSDHDEKMRKKKMHVPYTKDIDYSNDIFKLLAATIKLRFAEGDKKDEDEDSKKKAEATIRESKARKRVLKALIKSRLEATIKNGSWRPRMVEMAEKLELTKFEQNLLMLLVGNVISHDILIVINGRDVMRGDGQRQLTIGYVLFVLCTSLAQRVRVRSAFRADGPLIQHGLIQTSLADDCFQKHKFNADLMEYQIDIDRKVVDHLIGLESSSAEMVEGSRLYSPSVLCKSVVLPQETKEKVLSTLEHYELFARAKKKCGFGEGLGSQTGGLVFLFHGPSGTGKTMLANGIANELGKQVLLVALAQFKNDSKAEEILRFVFREAKLNDAIIFFDECESFFESRESNPLVTSVLAQFEKYDGIIIMATNRAQIIDEAMNRRISLMVEFRLPDHSMREEIWRAHLPETIKLADNVNVTALALGFELSGGLIKNAALAALSLAVARDKSEEPVVRQEDLIAGAKSQLRGFFQTNEGQKTGAAQYITPKRALSEMVLEKNISNQLNAIVKMTKSRNTLFSKWGFEEHDFGDESMVYLFTGVAGTGKSMAAEGIALDCGSTIRCMNVSEMFMKSEVSVQTIFEEGRKLGAIIVFDAAQALFDHSEKGNDVAKLIQYHSQGYPKPVIIIATTSPNQPSINDHFKQSSGLDFAGEVHFQLPSKSLRELLWKRTIPDKVPLAEDVDFKVLAEKQVSAKFIRSAAFIACSKVSLRAIGSGAAEGATSKGEAEEESQPKVHQKDFLDEIAALIKKQEMKGSHLSMFM